jgi:parvulin-like peptidyl-prolyl isomerase
MAKSSKKQKAAAAKQTKKQIASGRREARQNRIIWLSVGGLILLILVVFAAGLVVELVMKPAEPVAIVDGHRIRTDDYLAMLRYSRYTQHVTITNLQNSIQQLDQNDPSTQFLVSFYQQQLDQLQSNLALAPENVLDNMIDDELIREKAQEEGLAVTPAEVKESINQDLQNALYSPPQGATITETEQLPTPTPIPQAQLDQVYTSILGNIGLTDEEFSQIVERGLLSQKLQDLLASQVPTTGLVIHVHLIETTTEEDALAAQQRINGGEDFAIVAQEVSTDTLSASDGGDLGWITTGQLSSRYGQPVEDTAFSLPIGQTGVVQSGDRFYVLLVSERDDNGPLPQEVVSARQSSALSDWLAQEKASPDVQIDRRLDVNTAPPDPFLTPTPTQ